MRSNNLTNTVKPVDSDHPQDLKFVAVVVRWLLFRDSAMLHKFILGPYNSGHCRQVVINSGLTV